MTAIISSSRASRVPRAAGEQPHHVSALQMVQPASIQDRSHEKHSTGRRGAVALLVTPHRFGREREGDPPREEARYRIAIARVGAAAEFRGHVAHERESRQKLHQPQYLEAIGRDFRKPYGKAPVTDAAA